MSAPHPCCAMMPVWCILNLLCAGGGQTCLIEGCTALALWRGVCSEHTNTSAVQGAPHAAASLEINVVRDDDAEEENKRFHVELLTNRTVLWLNDQ